MADLPRAFTDRIRSQFGAEADTLIRSLDHPAETSVRINKRKPAGLSLEMDGQVPWCDDGFYLRSRPVFTLDPLLHAGCYYPQESSSMFLQYAIKQLFGDRKELTCLDFCAAPGGKSLILADFLQGRGRLISNEVNKTRNAVLREVLTKWGVDNVVVTSSQAPALATLKGYFDCVLIDAPCSGEGMFRKDHEARLEWTPAAVQVCSATQKDILSQLMRTVASGGFLIYSTCTFSQEENQDSCRLILDSGCFESVRLDIKLFQEIAEIAEDGFYGYQFLPHKVRGEGFFMSVFRRVDEPERFVEREQKLFRPLAKQDAIKLKEWGINQQDLIADKYDSLWKCPFTISELNTLSSALYITSPGVEFGKIIRDEFIPAHPYAMTLSEDGFERIYLDDADAVKYLRGESLITNAERGWYRIFFRNVALGWVKCVGGRCNNYYPKEYRIKMKNPGS
jgi:16S rRNA C967 or C1407 C5-methylase (RsmB/RsmF family)/NOL1/NOP2/fmu family ribosome biogenesis protein